MVDGVYQSIMVFFIPYLLFIPGRSITMNGINLEDGVRFGAYVAHPAVITINMYILINTYRWDWLMVLIVVISDLLIFFWTGVYTSFTTANVFYGAAAQVYQEASFWATFFIVPVICLFPRFAIKALQKVYWPYDVDIIREQERLGHYDHLTTEKPSTTPGAITSSEESTLFKAQSKHDVYEDVEEDTRHIYRSSMTEPTAPYQQHRQTDSDFTNDSGLRISMDMGRQPRHSIDRARRSYEASDDFTSAARLSRVESSQSSSVRFHRLRGLSLSRSPI